MANADWAVMTTLGVEPASIGAAVADGMREMVGLFDHDLRLVAANRNLYEALGYAHDDLLGRSALDLITPHHQDRAGLILGMASQQGTMGGSAPFDLVRADGSLLTIEITGADVQVGPHALLMAIGRQGDETTAVGLVLDRLLVNDDLDVVLSPLIDLFAWQLARSGVAITWSVDGTRGSVSTGLPDALTGMTDLGPDSPWARALRLAEPVVGPVDEVLDAATSALARERGFGQIWVEPVTTIADAPDATITVLSAEGGYSPRVHIHGVNEARRYLVVVLRWRDGFRRLEDAAGRDDLTDLANRRAFFAALADSPGGGAILFADLDGFKAVNDRWGHAVGDAVLVEVGRRLTATVEPGACVARIGGDEYAVILRGASEAEAAAAAERIRVRCAEPFHVGGYDILLGISVGVAHDANDLSANAVHAADRDQYADKRRRSTAG